MAETYEIPLDYDQEEFLGAVLDLAKKYARKIKYHPDPILADLTANLLGVAMVSEHSEDLYPQIMAKAQTQAEAHMRQAEIERKKAILRDTIPKGSA